MSDCPIITGTNPAVALVNTASEHYTTFATQNVHMAWEQINNLNDLQFQPVNFNVTYDFDDAIYGYMRPVAPQEPEGLTWQSPGDVPQPPDATLSDINFDTAPNVPTPQPPVTGTHTSPGPLDVAHPGPKPDIDPVVVPPPPDLEGALPEPPTLEALNLPDPPTLTLPPFEGVRPDTSLADPVHNFSFTPEQYTSDLLDRVRTRLDGMLDGGTGLPASVAQALRDRAFDALDADGVRAEQVAVEAFSARGFEQPNGILRRQLAEVRQKAQDQRGTLNRDIHIRDQEIAVQNLQFAVSQGIALESALMQNHQEFMRVSLATAQAAQQVVMELYNAKVAGLQLELQVYQADAQVWRELLQGELVKLEEYKAQLDAERIKGEINKDRVTVYSERVKAVLSLADIYRSQVAGAQATAAVNESILNGWKAEIEAYGEYVKAYAVEWDGYRAQIESDATRARIFEIVEQAWNTRVQTWDRKQQDKIAQQQANIDLKKLKFQGWETQLENARFELQREVQRNDTLIRQYGVRMDKYRADAAIETAASDANLRQLNTGLAREKDKTDLHLRQAEVGINQMLELNRQFIGVQQTITQTLTQLAAASMSAVNFDAGVRYTTTETQGCSTSFSYRGD